MPEHLSYLTLSSYLSVSNDSLMPELPELEVVQEVHNRRSLGQTILSAEAMPAGGPTVVRNVTGEGFGAALAGDRFESYPGGPAAT